MKKISFLYVVVLLFIINAVFAALPSYAQILTLEAWEMAGGSCPWVFPWNGAEYVKDNDIYSVARYPQGEYTDYYLLQQPLLPQGNNYTLEIREIEREDSWTDFTGLVAVDHASDVSVGTDDKGNISAFRPVELITPVSAVSNSGDNVNALINTEDDSGFNAYSEDYIEVDFGNADVSQGARVLLRVKGFLTGIGEDMPFIGPPAVVVQTFNGSAWQEIGRLKPRFEWSEGIFDLSSYLPDINGDRKIRLYSISHSIKYHEIDFVALSVGPEPAIEIKELALVSASFNGGDVSGILNFADDNYLQMTQGDKFSVSFASEPQTLAKRDFIFVSEGYYIPGNTYEIYTWDGVDWTMRDSYSFATTDEIRTFDLSSFLPDPNGEYKVRILQNYTGWGDAEIDYVSLDSRSLISATDLRDEAQWRLIYPTIVIIPDILSLVISSDDVRFVYPLSGPRNVFTRWTEYVFDDGDGVDAAIEDSAPNGGDGNDDGTPDYGQVNVTSLPGPNGDYITLESSPSCQNMNIQTFSEADIGLDNIYDYPYGLIGFMLDLCNPDTVRVYFHNVADLSTFPYRNFGPILSGGVEVSPNLWYTMSSTTFGTAVIDGNTVAYAEFTLTEGEMGDHTTASPIVSLGGPALNTFGIPAVNNWGMMIFMVLAGLVSVYYLRRKKIKS